jgi:hypothetical protein
MSLAQDLLKKIQQSVEEQTTSAQFGKAGVVVEIKDGVATVA